MPVRNAYRLRARKIIHTVGPVWRNGTCGERELLASCYERSLDLAVQHGLNSIAFPSISTGVYGFPKELAAPIALEAVRGHAYDGRSVREVLFCCFSSHDLAIYLRLLGASRD